MARILVIDDERPIRSTLREILEYEKYQVDEAVDGLSGLEKVTNEKYDVILCDIKMPSMDGLELLDRVLQISDTPVVMISGHGTIETAVEAIKKGAYDYIAKPLDLNRMLVTLRNALDKGRLVLETKTLKRKVSSQYDIVGESPAILHIKDMIERVATSDARVFITGDSGTGKELVARWLHEKSNRADGPFVEVNCAAIPSELIESVLFGHEKGSFTSAIKQRKGDFEQASGGTLFLDEIGDMSLAAQAKVLRALQENKIMRVGGEKEISIDVRVIAATNKNMQEEIANKNFRDDLYHRLNVIPIYVPPLTNRVEDIPLLVKHFAILIADNAGKLSSTFTDDALVELQKLRLTGNIRELRNIVERLTILCGLTITAEDVKMYARF